MLSSRKAICKQVCDLSLCARMGKINKPSLQRFSHNMTLYIDMFGVLMKDCILGYVYVAWPSHLME